jgi:hypothetical protein
MGCTCEYIEYASRSAENGRFCSCEVDVVVKKFTQSFMELNPTSEAANCSQETATSTYPDPD